MSLQIQHSFNKPSIESLTVLERPSFASLQLALRTSAKTSSCGLLTTLTDAKGCQLSLCAGQELLQLTGDSDWVKLNADQLGFFRVAYPPQLWAALTRAGADARGLGSMAVLLLPPLLCRPMLLMSHGFAVWTPSGWKFHDT